MNNLIKIVVIALICSLSACQEDLPEPESDYTQKESPHFHDDDSDEFSGDN